MSEEQVVNNDVITNEAGEPQRELRPEEQEAIARYRDSQQSKDQRESGMPEGYNEDGTPKEELIAGKFKSQEDLLKAYQELEKKQSQANTDAPEEPKADTEADKASSEPADEGSFTATKYEEEFVNNGSLSDSSYAELESKGFTRDQVDSYIRGQQAYAESVRNSIYDSVGGQENYMETINWASENLSPEIIADYNDAVDKMDQARILRNLEYMSLKRGQSAPREARRLEGNAPASGIQPFSNKNEWQRAMTDRLYGKDAKYTNMVDQRYLAARKKGIL